MWPTVMKQLDDADDDDDKLMMICYAVASVVGGRSRLHLLDLGSCGRAKDGSALSLTSLGAVLLALLSGQRHIPHRFVLLSCLFANKRLA